jgi:hypothetical protein
MARLVGINHVALEVGDAALEVAGVAVTRPPNCSFHDSWGNHMQVVDYREVMFTKTSEILRALGLSLEKTERALAELRERGLQ